MVDGQGLLTGHIAKGMACKIPDSSEGHRGQHGQGLSEMTLCTVPAKLFIHL